LKPASHHALSLLACLMLAACGGSDHHAQPQAEAARVGVAGQAAGVMPFVADISLAVEDITNLESVSFTIAAKPGSYSKPMSATYTRAWIDRTGAWRAAEKRLVLPVYGLYAGHANAVTLTSAFRDGSQDVEQLTVTTAAYSGTPPYATPVVGTARTATAAPGFDYMLYKPTTLGPAVVDADGNLRWYNDKLVGAVGVPTHYTGDAFYVGSNDAALLYRVDLRGTATSVALPSSRYLRFHHDMVAGKQGLLAEMDVMEGGVEKIESVLTEIGTNGEIIKEWDMGNIFRDVMRAGGDDPSNFVRDSVDWFHMNSAIYVPADDSLIVSSRENFVVKLDYATGRIKWLFGDTTKHWYVDYPSLRSLALTLAGGKAPIGQHAVSITSNGELLLFNNGWGSAQHPAGTSPGITRNFSTPSRYRIDESARTATEVWTFSPEPSVYSDICSSVYETTPGNYLINYAAAEGRTVNRVVSVNSAGQVALDLTYAGPVCSMIHIARPIDFSGQVFK
jgi:arylsulfate sulfotransferase